MLRALHAGLGRLLDEGLEAAWERHAAAAALLTAGLLARGFSYVAPQGHRLPMLHCVRVPDGVDAAAARMTLLSAFGIDFRAGLGLFTGECGRSGMTGYSCSEWNVLTLLSA